MFADIIEKKLKFSRFCRSSRLQTSPLISVLALNINKSIKELTVSINKISINNFFPAYTFLKMTLFCSKPQIANQIT